MLYQFYYRTIVGYYSKINQEKEINCILTLLKTHEYSGVSMMLQRPQRIL